MNEGEEAIQRYFRRTSDETLKLEFKRVSKYQPSTNFTVMAFIGIVLCVKSPYNEDDPYNEDYEMPISRDELLERIDSELRMRVL